MCSISTHAITRAKERWSLEKARNVAEIIHDTYTRAQPIGDFMDQGRPQRLMLDPRTKRVMVVNTDEDKVVTVWKATLPPMAQHLYSDIVRVHNRRIGITSRKIRTTLARYNRQRETLQSERDRLDAMIRELMVQRDHCDAILADYERELERLNMDKKTTIHSLANWAAAGMEASV